MFLIYYFFVTQATLEVFYGVGYIVGPTIGGLLFTVSIHLTKIEMFVLLILYFINITS